LAGSQSNPKWKIEPGKLADLVIVEGNPLVHIRDTTHVRKGHP
jgi:imidazolonepropionase-like amidohydrolase